MKPSVNSSGYLKVVLRHNKQSKNKYLHRLIAEHFIENPTNAPMVNHKDGNKLNNHVSNLEWCTRKQNVNHAVKNNLCDFKTNARQKHIKELNRSKRVLTVDKQVGIAELIGTTSQANIARIINVSPQTIMRFIKGNIYEETRPN